ncbi:MAG TPA: BlaI/MecI/CopY family transcriptional regulator [Candidatus Dormibacteraeota bacterium]|nr:BlaI/MecI/CopY family transcriptional regulator [Candidatus Dormibacteraeota bacterium]
MLRWLKSSLAWGHHLGPLESQLLRALWQRGDATVRELVNENAIEGAYTTVMTTLDRLHKKGLLDRVLDGRAFRYRPRQTEIEFYLRTLANNLEKLLGSARDTSAPLSFLVDTVTQHDARLLEELERVVDRKRQELRKRRKR